MSCEHCGDSGILNILFSVCDGLVSEDRYASSCHACEAGKVWRDVGID